MKDSADTPKNAAVLSQVVEPPVLRGSRIFNPFLAGKRRKRIFIHKVKKKKGGDNKRHAAVV